MRKTIFVYASQFPSGRWVVTYPGGVPIVVSSSSELVEALRAATIDGDSYELVQELIWPERIAHPGKVEVSEEELEPMFEQVGVMKKTRFATRLWQAIKEKIF